MSSALEKKSALNINFHNIDYIYKEVYIGDRSQFYIKL